MNQMMRLSARSTPGMDRTRSTRVSVNVCEKSMFGVLREVTQRSAAAWSMVTDALSSRPRKSPTCTKTRVTANATPATVMKNRSRSWTKLLSARSTTGNSSNTEIEHGLDAQLHRPPFDPRVRALRDLQRDDAMDGRPDDLRRQLDVGGKRGQELPGGRGLADRPEQKRVRILVRLALAFDRGKLLGRMRRHEHQPVVIRMLEREPRIRPAHCPQSLLRIGDGGDLLKFLGERPPIRVAQLADQRVLVLEVVVDRRRRVLDLLGDRPHGHRVVPMLGEQLARGVQDLGPDRDLFALAPIGCRRRYHNNVLFVNIVKIQTDVKRLTNVR